jgi:hypothetical protein
VAPSWLITGHAGLVLGDDPREPVQAVAFARQPQWRAGRAPSRALRQSSGCGRPTAGRHAPALRRQADHPQSGAGSRDQALAAHAQVPHQLKDKYQAEFRAAGHKSQPVQTVEQETARLRTELGKARAEQRRLTELNQTYAAIINQLADDLAQATAERDTLTAAGSVTRITTRHQVPPSG